MVLTYLNVPSSARKSLWNMFISCASIALKDVSAPGESRPGELYLQESNIDHNSLNIRLR